jgi:tetratricopeptide (TPR) repeat protein
VRLKPDDAFAHLNFGSVLGNLGRLDEAIAQFTEALRIKPDLPEARQDLQYALSLKNKPAKREDSSHE